MGGRARTRPLAGRLSERPAVAPRGDRPLLVRAATERDLAAVHAIEVAAFSDPWSRGSFASLLRDPRVLFAVAESDDLTGVIGYVVAWFVVDEAEVANVAVAPGARGRGVGARLLDEALDVARERGVTAVYLEVRDSNAAARALYESRGFEQVGRRRRYYRRPVEDALVMRRELGPDGPPADRG